MPTTPSIQETVVSSFQAINRVAKKTTEVVATVTKVATGVVLGGVIGVSAANMAYDFAQKKFSTPVNTASPSVNEQMPEEIPSVVEQTPQEAPAPSSAVEQTPETSSAAEEPKEKAVSKTTLKVIQAGLAVLYVGSLAASAYIMYKAAEANIPPATVVPLPNATNMAEGTPNIPSVSESITGYQNPIAKANVVTSTALTVIGGSKPQLPSFSQAASATLRSFGIKRPNALTVVPAAVSALMVIVRP